MRYSQYYPIDVLNGPGTRAVLFVSGCEHFCKDCYNKASWKFSNGEDFDEAMVERILNDLKDTKIKRRGLTISGGEPLHPRNLDVVKGLLQRVREEAPDKDVWLWSGYECERLTAEQLEVVKLIDVLVDGPFKVELKDPSLIWRGSSNQRVLHRTIVFSLLELRNCFPQECKNGSAE